MTNRIEFILEPDRDEEPDTLWKLLRFHGRRLLYNRAIASTLCCATGVGAPWLIAGHRASLRIVRREVELRLASLPVAFDGYRILFISDIHCRNIGKRERRLVELVSQTPADLLLLGGDYAVKFVVSSPEAALECCRMLAECREFPDGVAAVRGNHNEEALDDLLREQNFMRYLRDTTHVVSRGGAQLAVCGSAYAGITFWRHYYSQRRLLGAAPPDAFRLLLTHSPNAFPSAAALGFDLALAGDTHGGQLRLPGIGAVMRKTDLPRRYTWGLNKWDGMPCYTSAGVGVTGLPARINCPPEIVRFTLRYADEWSQL
ncbi:metallophosphoesterase family protein [Candidatus Sumerlaeota bacterium]|nr:metallophosphoesterase family protein [Candidatus Sumerlaeota bacterium]